MIHSVGKAALVGEILAEDDDLRVFVAPHPFRTERDEHRIPAGLTIAELAERFGGDIAMARRWIVFLDGNPIPSEVWHRVRPKPKTTLVLRAVAEDPITAGIGAIISAVSSVTAGISAAFAGLGALGSTLAGLAISYGLNLLLGALFPPAKPAVRQEPSEGVQGFSISASRNQAAQFETIPVILGRHRVTPYYGALPYTESVNNDQYLRMLFVIAYGPVLISDIRIGETSISSFTDVEIQQFPGFGESKATPIYPSVVIEEPLSVELNMDDGWQSRTTATDVTTIQLDFVCPNGLVAIDKKKGSEFPIHLYLQAQCRLVGSGEGGWVALDPIDVTLSTRDTLRLTMTRSVAAGQYDVQVRKNTKYVDDSFSQFTDGVSWVALRGLRNGTPVTYPKPLAMIAVRIKATSQLNGPLETLNLVAEPYVETMTGVDGFTMTQTSNPADLFLHVLRMPANSRPVPLSQIDVTTLRAWKAYCVAEGWTYCRYVTTRQSVYDMLIEIAAAGRAVPLFKDGLWSVVWDRPEDAVVQVFTPRNSWGFEAKHDFPDRPHAFRVKFVNAAKNFVDDERIVYDDGYDATNATRFEGLEFPGVTNSDLVWRHARFYLAQIRLRPETYVLNVDFENLVVTRGDRVRIAHDVMLLGSGAGRVTSVNAATRTIVIDELVAMLPGTAYAIRFRLSSGVLVLYPVTTVAGETNALKLEGTAPLPEVGDLGTFGEAERDSAVYRVMSIDRQGDLTAAVTLVDDGPGIAQADKGAIPPFVSNVTQPIDPYTLPPMDLRANVQGYVDQDRFLARIHLDWLAPRFGKIDRFQVGYRDAGRPDVYWIVLPDVLAPGTVTDILDVAPGLYVGRVRTIFTDGSFSGWIESAVISTAEVLTPPPTVETFRIATIGDTARLTWDLSADPSVKFYEVRFSASSDQWNTAITIAEQALPGLVVPTMIGTYLIKGGRPDGARSVLASVIRSSVASLSGLNVVEVLDESATGFAGAKDRVSLMSGELRIQARNTISRWESLSSVLSMAAGDGAPDTIGLELEGIYSFATYVDLGSVCTSRVTAEIEAEGETAGNLMSSWVRLSDVTALDNASPEDWSVVLEYQSTDGDPAGSPTWSAWRQILVGDITARVLRFRLRLLGRRVGTIDNPYSMTTPVVRVLSVSVDMPDRTVGIEDLVVPPAGRQIDFSPAFRVVPAIATADQNMQVGDYAVISGKTSGGFFIRYFNSAGTPIQRVVDVVAKGYGSMS